MFVPADPNFDPRVRASFERQTFMRTLGVRMTALTPGKCELTLPYQPSLCQQHGFLHAGVVTTVSDTAAGYAAFSLMPADSSVLSVEYKQNLLAPAVGDELIARGEVIRAGRNITVVLTHAYTRREGTEKLVGLLQATIMCMHGMQEA